MTAPTLTIRAARERMRAGETTSVALTQGFLERIRRLNPRLNVFITVDEAQALEMARDADARRAAGEDTPLLGVPIAVKDLLTTRGLRTTGGSKILEPYVPTWDATVIARLRKLGAVIVGKANCDEFGMGSSNENSAYGPARNPWDVTRVPGGSSGGSAAAVAAGLCCAALGTDTGGSIRQPSSLCNTTGLKNSYGRVSRFGLLSFASSLDTIGAITQDAWDAAIMLAAIEGRDARDSTSADPADFGAAPIDPRALDAAARSLDGLRVGVPREYFIEGIQPEVEAAVRAGVEVLRGLGARVVEVSLPNTSLGLPVYYLIAPAEASANLARYDGVRFGLRVQGDDLIATYMKTRGAGFGAEVKRRIMLGTYALSAGYYDAYYLRAQKVRTLIKRDFEQAFAEVDVIAAPVSPTTAFALGAKVDDPIQMYLEDVFTLPVSLAGVCGISVPCGFDGAGLPIGMQLIGPAFGEQRVLEVSHAFQSATDFHHRRPDLDEPHQP